MAIFVNSRFLTQPLSGVQRYAIECSQQIKKMCPETVFLSPPGIIHHEIARQLGVIIVGKRNGQLWEQVDLAGYMARQKNAPLLNLANTAPLLYRNNWVTIHDLAFYHHPEWNSRIFSTWYNFLIPRLARKAKHIFTVSETIRKEICLAYKIPEQKISVTYNGISHQMLNEPAQDVAKENIILSVGSFNLRKNHHNLINAFLNSSIPDRFKLVLIGDKHKVFREGGIDEKVVAKGNIEIYEGFSDDQLRDMYRRAKVVASLSLYEGFGIPILEGLFYGCKVLCSDIAVYRELYDGYASFCNPVDIDNISEALDKTGETAPRTDISALLNKYSYEASAKVILDNVNR